MVEYVITRPSIYRVGSVEWKDATRRRPYYADANSADEAKQKIRFRYNLPTSEPLDCEVLLNSPFAPYSIKQGTVK